VYVGHVYRIGGYGDMDLHAEPGGGYCRE
jgi:hypothetical protein